MGLASEFRVGHYRKVVSCPGFIPGQLTRGVDRLEPDSLVGHRREVGPGGHLRQRIEANMAHYEDREFTQFNDRRNLTSRHRLRGFDYRNPGYYFVTICVNHRKQLLGYMSGGEVHRTPAGGMVADVINSVPDEFPGVELDCFVIMPNHIHVLFYLLLDDSDASLSDVVRWVKGVSTNRYGHGVKAYGWPLYDRKFWQESFNDQIVRNDRHLAEARRYIEENPVKWELDELHGL